MDSSATDHHAGQTFQCPEEGLVKKIKIYSVAVSHPGKIILSLHDFDRKGRQWGNVISSSEIEVNENDSGNWMEFPLQSTRLLKDNAYGFRLTSPDTLVALGEAAWPSKYPFEYGEEWNSNNIGNDEHFYRYFSLAFKVELRA